MSKFSILIQNWYHQNHRDLPWRNTNNPYFIWLSEIILQQTRVDQGMSYYLRFIDQFPTIKELANADEESVLNLWQGLGYYSRARNLHFASKQVMNDCDGQFPSTYNEIIKLKGVGDYTASAIASFAYKEPHAVVDGNVYRVLSRYLGISTPIDSSKGLKQFKDAAHKLMDEQSPDTHNQAMMELGALVCTPKSPSCSECPVAKNCFAFEKNLQMSLPIKSKKTKVKKRHIVYLVIYDAKNGLVCLRKRTENDIWKNLYDFPSVESEKKVKTTELKGYLKNLGFQKPAIEEVDTLQHKLTHRAITATFYKIETDYENLDLKKFNTIKINDLSNYPIPRLMDKFLEKNPSIFTH